ncbi:zinc-dependent alcohol dehydrogenase family protein [Phytohalomonas tamaricis]|uniref:zinc-dependent alcohol dehydrogenase family protein n=1 Tax=Phytohalomonas tamaricis TaxID=2081032 RepID=UPI000D0B5D94|nr:zinc-dependent alcohol dehydrogenase family protein [Phytohalomonas tamaricis]
MSRVIRFNRFGPADVLEYVERPDPQPEAGEVLLATEAIGVGWHDVLWRQNLASTPVTLPAGIGTEMAGRVVSVGAGVDDLSPGDRVAAIPAYDLNRYATYGERIVLPREALVRYAQTLTAVEASVHYLPLLTSWLGLRELAGIEPGESVLITAGCQIGGPYAVQLARALGAHVFATTTRADNVEFLKRMGAEAVIETESQDLVTAIDKLTDKRGVNVVLDAQGGPQMSLLGDVLAPCGRLVLYGLQGGNQTAFPAQAAFRKNIRFYLHCLSNFSGRPELGIAPNGEAMKRAIDEVNRLTLEGAVVPVIDKVFGFDEVVAAHRYMDSMRSHHGRVALKVG